MVGEMIYFVLISSDQMTEGFDIYLCEGPEKECSHVHSRNAPREHVQFQPIPRFYALRSYTNYRFF